MSIIFYEYEYCQEILRENVKRITLRDLKYLAKYWDYEGVSYENIAKNLEEFCVRNDRNFNAIQSAERIQKAVNHAKNNYIRFPTPIIITQAEVDTIRSLDNYIQEKFLFSMLVCAKYFKQNKSQKKHKRSIYDNTLYSNSSIRYLKEIARVKFTGEYWKNLKHEFTVKGLISPTIVSSSKWAIGFWNENSKPCFIINDYRNVIAYYQEYCGEVMIDCENCKVRTAKRSYRHRMCNKCWKEREKEMWRKSSKKYYENKNSHGYLGV
jgi:hypothetical protein